MSRFLSGFTVAMLIAFLLSCGITEERRAILVVPDRDALGRYITPVCPACKEAMAVQCTKFICSNGHVCETKGVRLK
jgi:hypothetical protein